MLQKYSKILENNLWGGNIQSFTEIYLFIFQILLFFKRIIIIFILLGLA